jgi:hypothetical protein
MTYFVKCRRCKDELYTKNENLNASDLCQSCYDYEMILPPKRGAPEGTGMKAFKNTVLEIVEKDWPEGSPTIEIFKMLINAWRSDWDYLSVPMLAKILENKFEKEEIETAVKYFSGSRVHLFDVTFLFQIEENDYREVDQESMKHWFDTGEFIFEGQEIPKPKSRLFVRKTGPGNELFSEDIW